MSEVRAHHNEAATRTFLEAALESLKVGDWEAGVIDAGRALAITSQRGLQAVALDAIAMGHLELGRLEPASVAALEALRLGSEDGIDVLHLIAERFVSEGDSGRGHALLEAAHKASPTQARIVAALAVQAQRGGDYPSAIRWFDMLDRIDPDGADGRRQVVTGVRDTVEKNDRTRRLLSMIGARITAVAGRSVFTGPFAGQVLEAAHDFGWIATLLGCYELELHPAIEQVIQSKPRVILNVGCSGGYYAVGFALRIPEVQVIAYDIDASAREACARAALANGVSDRVTIRGACTPEELQKLAGPETVVFCDCEGYELQLLDPAVVPALASTTIIVELHDVWVPNLGKRLLRRFVPSHQIGHIAMLPRRPEGYEVLTRAGLSDGEAALAISDFRPEGMTWAYMVPRHVP